MNSKKEMTDNSVKAETFLLRMPPGMRGKLAEMAKTNHRSMNSQILSMLEEHAKPDD